MGRVASHCVLEEFAKDQKIINKGDHGDKFYIIKSGMVKCKIDDVHPALFQLAMSFLTPDPSLRAGYEDIRSTLRASNAFDFQLWSDMPPSEAAMKSTSPFAYDAMPLEQWLQFIFLPASLSWI